MRAMRLIAKLVSGTILAVLAYIALGGAMAALAGPLKMRGEMVDVGGGRRMHLVCEGPRGAGPTVLFEAGAFGFSADWGVVQDKVAAQGFHTCSYDRAGLGLSDPGPAPRDGLAVVGDLERLLAGAHEDGPFILVGHSMAGLYLRLYAARNPDKVKGLVLVDATTPEAIDDPAVRGFVTQFTRASNLASFGASMGLYAPLAGTWFGDKIGLTPAASAEKRRAFASPRHNRAAAIEVAQWFRTAEEAKAAGRLDPAWPVAVVVAGPSLHRLGYKSAQFAPAHQSRHGYTETVEDGRHATLLGVKFADHIVKAIDFVRDAAAAKG
ncbi:MAG: alpha/beta fold hydrolase [Caulobacteraceae bacterium]|nr:alpha/beta fold hydrolase [Caulobacteraceae bacterium]